MAVSIQPDRTFVFSTATHVSLEVFGTRDVGEVWVAVGVTVTKPKQPPCHLRLLISSSTARPPSTAETVARSTQRRAGPTPVELGTSWASGRGSGAGRSTAAAVLPTIAILLALEPCRWFAGTALPVSPSAVEARVSVITSEDSKATAAGPCQLRRSGRGNREGILF